MLLEPVFSLYLYQHITFHLFDGSPSLLVHEGYGHLQHPRHRLAAPSAQAHDTLRPGAVGDTNLVTATVKIHYQRYHDVFIIP